MDTSSLLRLPLPFPMLDRHNLKAPHKVLFLTALTEEKLVKIRELNGLAAGRGQTLAEMALSWILKDGIVTSVLVGESKQEQILDNIKAIQNTEFTEEELRKIDELSLV